MTTATITKDLLNGPTAAEPEPRYDDTGVTFILCGDEDNAVTIVRRFNAYDDDGERYYAITAHLRDDDDLGDLLNQLGAYAGVTELRDVTGDGDDWSAS